MTSCRSVSADGYFCFSAKERSRVRSVSVALLKGLEEPRERRLPEERRECDATFKRSEQLAKHKVTFLRQEVGEMAA